MSSSPGSAGNFTVQRARPIAGRALVLFSVARWAYGIQNSRLNDFPPFAEADIVENRRLALHCSAVVNLKKIAGGNASNPRELRQSVLDHGDLIQEQIELLNLEQTKESG